MKCGTCGNEFPDGSAFCNHCGVGTTQATAAPVKEETVWEGGYSGWALGHWWLLYMVGAAGFVAAAVAWKFSAWVVLVALLLPAAGLLGAWLVEKITVHYRLSTTRLFKSTGFLVRRHDELELFRVDDIVVKQNLVERIFNVGTVTLFAPTDQTHPQLTLEGIRDPLAVKEKIREIVFNLKKRSIRLEQI